MIKINSPQKKTIKSSPQRKVRVKITPRKLNPKTKVVAEVSAMDRKIKELGVSEFADAIKECASGVDTLQYISVNDLMSDELVNKLTNEQARLVVWLIRKSSSRDENKNPNIDSLCKDLDSLEFLEKKTDAEDIYDCLESL